MKIYGHISAETMAQHEWVTLEDHLAAIEDELRRITALKADAKRLERRLATKEQVIIREMERAGKAKAENDRLRAALDKATGPVSDWWFKEARPIINAIGEISVQEAMDAIERGLK